MAYPDFFLYITNCPPIKLNIVINQVELSSVIITEPTIN